MSSIKETLLDGVLVITNQVHSDNRGSFREVFRESEIKQALKGNFSGFVQENESYNREAGTIRGLHFQYDPMAQAKLVRCTQGALIDVVVDIRKKSPTFGKHLTFFLTANDETSIFIPEGFAHGFETVVPNTVINYKVNEYFSKDHDACIHYQEFGIPWKTNNPIISEKDKNGMGYMEYMLRY